MGGKSMTRSETEAMAVSAMKLACLSRHFDGRIDPKHLGSAADDDFDDSNGDTESDLESDCCP